MSRTGSLSLAGEGAIDMLLCFVNLHIFSSSETS